MEDLPKLKQCPFCGGNAKYSERPGSWGYYPATVSCGCTICSVFRKSITMDDRMDAWQEERYQAHSLAAASWNERG